MNTLGYALVFATLAGYIAFLALWLVAENRCSKLARVTFGLLAIQSSISVSALPAVAVTRFDDQSHYASSVQTLLDETVDALGSGEGTGKAPMFAGTAFEGALGERAIEILVNGKFAVWVGECCSGGGLSKTDALAFNALYEQLASQARAAFGALGVQAAGNATQIAVSVLDAEHGGIYVLNADGSGKQRLTTGKNDILPRWSPDGKQIAFLALREQDHELAAEHDLAFHWFLYVMDADGQNQRRVTKTPIGMIFQWSPDGSRFVFQSSCEDGNNKAKDGTVSSAIYVMKADGTKQKRLTPVEKNDGFPSWSPDGKQIAFCSNQHGNMDIFVMNADGSDVRRLTSNDANDIGPTWSPDGKQIAFASSRKSGNAHVMNADGTQESPLIVRGRPVAWSPEGQSLLLENDGQLVLSGADGRNQKELTKAGEPALDGEYSPDGKAVFYRSKVNGTWTLMSVDTERSSQKRIWSDSGRFLGFSVSPSRVSLAEDSSPLSTSNTHLTEFGNACRKSETLYDDSRKELFALIPDFLDWKRREIEIPYSSTTNAFEVRVIFSPPDGTKAHVAVLVSGNRHLVENKKVDISEVDPAIVWGASTILTEAEFGRYDGHLLKQAAFVLEGNLADKDALDAYLESVDFKRIGKFVSSRLTKNAK